MKSGLEYRDGFFCKKSAFTVIIESLYGYCWTTAKAKYFAEVALLLKVPLEGTARNNLEYFLAI